MINVGFGLDREEIIEEIEVEVDEDEEPADSSADNAAESNAADEEEIVINADTMTHTASKMGGSSDDDAGPEDVELHDDL